MDKKANKYAVIKIKGHQHKVSTGDALLVDRLGDTKPEAEVLLVVDGDKVKVGNPTVKGASVALKVLEEVKGQKLHVRKFKAKSRYRKHIGFRPKYTKLQIGKIS